MKLLGLAMILVALVAPSAAQGFRRRRDSSSVELEQSDEFKVPILRSSGNPYEAGGHVDFSSRFHREMRERFQPSSIDSSPSRKAQNAREFHRRVISAVGNTVRRVSAIRQSSFPYILTTITSSVYNPQQGFSASNSNGYNYDQSNRQPQANGVVYPSSSASSSSNANSRQFSNGFNVPSFQQSSNLNPFPVVVLDAPHGQQSPPPPFGQSPSNNGGSVSIPVASGGATPPSGYVPNDPFVLNFDQIDSLSSSSGQQTQNSFGNVGTLDSRPSQDSPSSGGSFNNPSQNSNNFGGGSQGSFSQGSPQPQTSNHFGSSSSNSNGFGPTAMPEIFTVVNGIQEFTLDLISTFRGMSQRGNVVFSPISIASLLSLLTLATNGLSRQEIEIALHLPNTDSSNAHHKQYEDILRRLNHNSQGINITTSSRLFLEKSSPVHSSFTRQAAQHYNCSVSLENFRGRPAQTMRRVNRWVAEETRGKITEFITAPFSPDTKFVAANTIYFSGDWETPFPEYFTGLRDFDTGRETIRVPMMTNVFTTPHYYSSEINADIVSIPYKGGEFSMFIILPRESPKVKSIKVLESQLDTFLIDELIGNMTSKSVSISLPKMRLAMKSSLVGSLSELNIQSIFSPITADFSGLTSTRPLWVSAFLHEAVMEVNEIGTVAAAVSAASLDRIGGYQRININKPASIFIRDHITRLPLFWATLMKPEPLS